MTLPSAGSSSPKRSCAPTDSPWRRPGRAKKEGGLPSNYQPEVLDPFIDDMTQQVSRSLQFYLASGSGRSQPDQILICGGCANIPGVAEVISSRVGVPADKGDPLGNMKVSSKAKAQAVGRDATALVNRLRPRAAKLRLRAAMPRINLLPHREQERKDRRREFGAFAARRRGRARWSSPAAARSSTRAGSMRRTRRTIS